MSNKFKMINLFMLLLSVLMFPPIVKAEICPTQNQNPCWIEKAQMPTARREFGIASDSAGKVYVVGGYTGFGSSAEGNTDALEAYNASTDTWSTKSPIPVKLNSLGFAYNSNGKFYAVGGFLEGVRNDVYEYDPINDTWNQKSSMPTPRFHLGLTAYNGKLYAIGGLTENGPSAAVEEYDPQTNLWTSKSPMPTPRGVIAVTMTPDGKVYVFGGQGQATVEEYNIVTDQWTEKAPMFISRSGLTATLTNQGKIYAIGGNVEISETPPPWTDVIEEYTLSTNTWVTKSPFPVAIHKHGAVSLNEKIFVVGGETKTSQAVNTSYLGFIPDNPQQQISALDPAKIWVSKGLLNIGVKLDFLAEVYKDSTLVSSGQVNSIQVGSGGFNNASLVMIPFSTFAPVSFASGSALKLKVSVRNACNGSLLNNAHARLWYNDVSANSRFGATINTANDYYLRSSFALATAVGSGPRQNQLVDAGAKCSAFKPFGTWSITP